MSTWDEVEAEFEATEHIERIPMAASKAARVAELEAELRVVRQEEAADDTVGSPHAARAVELATEIERLSAQVAASERRFVFRGIGRKAFTDLLAAHPPTAEQRAQAAEQDRDVDFNAQTFPPALIAATLVEPTGITPERACWLWDAWPDGVLARLFAAAIAVNKGVTETPKSLIASAVLRGSAKNSTTAPRKASRGRSS